MRPRAPGERIYRALILCAYPPRFRKQAERELVSVFRQGRRAVGRAGGAAVARFWLLTLADIGSTAPREWAVSLVATLRSGSLSRRNALREIRHSARRLLAAPGHAALAVLTLTVGLASIVTVFSVVRGVLLQPLPFDDAERIVRLLENDGQGRLYWPSYPDFVDWRERARGFDSLTVFGSAQVMPVRLPGGVDRVSVAGAGRDFLRTLGVRPQLGRDFTAGENRPGGPPAALVSYGFWRRQLGGAGLADLTLGIDGESLDVVGVLPPGFRIFEEIDVWVPLERRTDLGSRGSHGYHVLARITQGRSLAAARRELDEIAAEIDALHGGETHVKSILTTRLRDELVGEAERPLTLLLGAAALVFAVACLNLATTVLARGLTRSRELAVRRALGAGRADVVRHLLAESVVLALPGTLLGTLLAAGSLEWLRRVAAGIVPRVQEVEVDAGVLWAAILLALAAALVAATLPAAVLARADVADRLSGRGETEGRRGRRMWGAFLAAQVALTLVLIVGAGLLSRSVWSALSVDLGYRPENVLTVDVTLPEHRYPDGPAMTGYWQRALKSLRRTSGVAAAGIANVLPTETQAFIGMAWPPGDQEAGVWVGWRMVDPGFFETLRIPVESVGWRPPADPSEGRVAALVSEEVAERLWPDGGARGRFLGNSFGWPEERLLVAGQVGEVREWWQDVGDLGAIYVDYRAYRRDPAATRSMHLVVRTGDDSAVGTIVADVRRTLGDVDPEVPVTITPLDQRIGASLADRRLTLGVLVGFALAALLLAVVAIYGAVAYTVARRTREVGIRRALGARPFQVRRLVAARGLVPVLGGLGVGLVGALVAAPLLGGYLFGVEPRDPAVLIAATLALSIAAVLASWFPSRRAARVDPLETLRLEG